MTKDASDISTIFPKQFIDAARQTAGFGAVMNNLIDTGSLPDWYEEVGIDGDWTHVRQSGTRQEFPRAKVQIVDGFVLLTTKKTEWVVDEQAVADLRVLAAKWAADGRDHLAAFPDKMVNDDEYEGNPIYQELGQYVTTTTDEKWPVAECEFVRGKPVEFKIPQYPRWTTTNI